MACMPTPMTTKSMIIWMVTTTTRRLGSGGDVTEPNRAEDRDGEVQRVGVRQRLREDGVGELIHHRVRSGETNQKQGHRHGQSLDGPQDRGG